jgi:hypothetical protein
VVVRAKGESPSPEGVRCDEEADDSFNGDRSLVLVSEGPLGELADHLGSPLSPLEVLHLLLAFPYWEEEWDVIDIVQGELGLESSCDEMEEDDVDHDHDGGEPTECECGDHDHDHDDGEPTECEGEGGDAVFEPEWEAAGGKRARHRGARTGEGGSEDGVVPASKKSKTRSRRPN